MNDDVPTVCARDLGKSFGKGAGRICVFERLSLDLAPGKLSLCVGPSGSGKSTLISILGGLLKPDTGTVRLLGEDIWAMDDRARDAFRLKHCGFVFQGFNLFASLTALEQVLLVLRYTGVGVGDARELSLAALAEVGLESRSHLRPDELSGGEKQRVAIARAIVKQPKLIFADEPTSALDGKTGQRVIDVLHAYSRRHAATILCVTHDPRLLGHADRVIELEDGQIVSTDVFNAHHSPSVPASPPFRS